MENWCCSKTNCKINSAHSKQLITDVGFKPKLEKNFMTIKIGDHRTPCLVDSGADICAISKYLLDIVAPEAELRRSHLQVIVGVCGEQHKVLGQVDITFQCEGVKFTHNFHVFQHLHTKILVGIDFLRKYKVQMNFGELEVVVPNSTSVKTIKVPTQNRTPPQTSWATTLTEVIVPPHCEVIVPVRISKIPSESLVLLEPRMNLQDLDLAGGKTVIKVQNSKGAYRLINPTSVPVFLSARQREAKASLIDDPSTISVLLEPNSANIFNLSALDSEQDENNEEIVKNLGIDIENNNLTIEQKQKLIRFLGKNRDIFTKDLSELGSTNLHNHVINTGDAKPVSSAPYRQNPEKCRILGNLIKEMEESGIIEESTSPWHSPVVLVRKPNNEWRFAVDYRKLNAVTELMSFPIPHMTDVFDTLADAKASVYSTLDLLSGFWQVPLHKSTKHKSAFITEQGIYEFNRLSFGLVNAPMTFQSLMTKVLKNLNFKIALIYIDDLIVFSKDFDEHLHHLDLVFTNLRQANLKLHLQKCKFGTHSVKYLGHIVTKDGIKVLTENTDKIKNAERPKNAKQVKQTLGMFGYYRKFVKDFAKIAKPLHYLLKKDVKFKWTDECENAFQVLKHKLITAPILRYPDFNNDFILAVYASDFSTGYMLSQMHEGKEHPLCFGGRALHNNELRWHITDKEGLVLVEGIQHFRHYLAGKKFTVYTNNVSVKYLQKIKDCQGRLGRWSILLQAYQFDIQHRSGSTNCNADFLSRQRYQQSTTTASSELADHISLVQTDADKEYTKVTLVYPGEDEETIISALTTAEANNSEGGSFTDLAKHQRECPDFRDIYNYLAYRKVPKDPHKARTVVAESFNYELVDNVLQHFYSRR